MSLACVGRRKRSLRRVGHLGHLPDRSGRVVRRDGRPLAFEEEVLSLSERHRMTPNGLDSVEHGARQAEQSVAHLDLNAATNDGNPRRSEPGNTSSAAR